MKKTLLSIIVLLTAGSLSAQVCTPNPEYADEGFGIWPSPEEGFAAGEINISYSQVIDFKIPEDPNELPDDLLSQFPISPPEGSTIDSVSVQAVTGLPNGLDWDCASHTPSNCTFMPDEQGCAIITGVPTEIGTFPLVIEVRAYLTVPGFGQIPGDFDYTDYEIVVEGEGTSVGELAQYGMNVEQNAPNPFSDLTVIEFSLNQPQMVELNVFNLLGKNIHSRSINATGDINRIELNASELNMSPGIYLYSLSIDGNSATRKMIVK